jgi:N-acetylglucosaminyldiphosphoundecaprenol N-acetyl-beta-D-mannosaminyltransferase
MTSSGFVNMLGVRVAPINLPQAIATLDQWHAEGRRDYVCFTTVNGLMHAERNPDVRLAFNRAGLATEDGMPVVWWCRRAGYPDAGRVYGPDLLLAMCKRSLATGYRHFFYGGNPGVAQRLAQRLRDRFPGLPIVGWHSPPFRALTLEEDEMAVRMINRAAPDFVWVGLGTPKQERWMAEHVGKIQATALLGVGAAFDFLSGEKRQAPYWMQRSGLEWFFRLATEPRRLARRYIVDNSLFVLRVVQQRSGLRTYSQEW